MCPVCSRTRSPKAAFRRQACRQHGEAKASLPECGWNGEGQHLLACKQVLLWSSHFQTLPKSQCQKSITVLWRVPQNEDRFCTVKKTTLLHCLHPRFARLFLSPYNRKLWQEAPEVQADTTHPPHTRVYTHCYHLPPPSPLLPSAAPAEQSKHWVSPSSGRSPALITHCSPAVASVR